MQSSQFKISGLLKPTLFGSKTRQPLETYSRSEQTKPFGDHPDLPLTRGVGYLIRFQVTYFHIPIQEQSRTCLRIHTQGRAYQFKALPFGLSKGGETDGNAQGFKNPPVPRRLVGESQIPPGVSPTYTGTSKLCVSNWVGW